MPWWYWYIVIGCLFGGFAMGRSRALCPKAPVYRHLFVAFINVVAWPIGSAMIVFGLAFLGKDLVLGLSSRNNSR